MTNLLLYFAAVTLSWNASTCQPNRSCGLPTGYKVYWGTNPQDFTASYDVGDALQVTLEIDTSTARTFVVRAYNQWGESADSQAVVVGKPQAPVNLGAQ